MGAGTEPQPDGETDQDLVPEQEDEEQEEHSETGGQPGSQQQQRERRQWPRSQPVSGGVTT